jgi:hypothetical protein
MAPRTSAVSASASVARSVSIVLSAFASAVEEPERGPPVLLEEEELGRHRALNLVVS